MSERQETSVTSISVLQKVTIKWEEEDVEGRRDLQTEKQTVREEM